MGSIWIIRIVFGCAISNSLHINLDGVIFCCTIYSCKLVTASINLKLSD